MKDFIVLVLLLTLVGGVTGCVANSTDETHTDEEIVKAMLVEDYGHENFEVEITGYDKETDDLKYLSYENGDLRWCGTVDKSWCEFTYCK